MRSVRTHSSDLAGEVAMAMTETNVETQISPTTAEEDGKVQTPASLVAMLKSKRRASLVRECKGDYVDVPNDPYLSKLLSKQGDKKVLFADMVVKFTGSGKMKKRIMLITDFAIYLVDPDVDMLKRRIALAAVEKLCVSRLSDKFFAIIIPSEYDCLMASTRKSEIVDVLDEAIKSTSDYELEVDVSNRFEYHAASNMVKEVQFEEVNGGIKTRIAKKEESS